MSTKSQNTTYKEKILLTLAYLFSVLATLCCLPALLFLLFGFSFGVLGVEVLGDYRVFLSIVGVGFFGAYLWYVEKSCKDGICTNKVKSRIFQVSCGIMLGCILFYPEIVGWLYA